MTFSRQLKDELEVLARRNLLRTPVVPDAKLTSFASNDYLALSSSPFNAEGQPLGAGASRLLAGTHETHLAAERALADYVAHEQALLFASGYMANLAVLTSLLGPEDLIVSDQLNHASLVDGARLSRARVQVYRHLDLDDLDEQLRNHRPHVRRAAIVTESLFSMDGDSPDLASLRALADQHDAFLVVDEAHALGVIGPHGRGLSLEHRPDVLVGTLGKAFGLAGAFVAGADPLRQYLQNRARTFIYTTAPSPGLTAAIPSRVQQVGAADDARARLRDLSDDLRARLPIAGNPHPGSPILPIILGSSERALRVSGQLRSAGLFVPAIRPPTVPEGTARLRISLRADHSASALNLLTEALSAELR